MDDLERAGKIAFETPRVLLQHHKHHVIFAKKDQYDGMQHI